MKRPAPREYKTPQQAQMVQQITRIPSRYLDGTPMYPGLWLLTYIKPPFFPWMLLSMAPYEERADA